MVTPDYQLYHPLDRQAANLERAAATIERRAAARKAALVVAANVIGFVSLIWLTA